MAGPIPNVPSNVLVQAGNQQVYLSWSPAASAASYNIYRSLDNVTFTLIANVAQLNYYDTSVVIGTLYYYSVSSKNVNGESNLSASISVTAVNFGQMSLGQVRLAAQQRADMINSSFVTTQEWNSYINQSYTELFDLMVQVYADDYFVAPAFQFVTDGRYPSLYPLPQNMYKLLGVDLGVNASNNSWLTLSKLPFLDRNRYIYGNTPTTFFGILNLKYRILGTNILFVPQPSSGQQMQLWYIPRPLVLLADSDTLDSVSGWSEYVIVDAAIKAMQKEESDVAILAAQKLDLRHRIEAAASNRDAGVSEGVTDSRRLQAYSMSNPFGDLPIGGW